MAVKLIDTLVKWVDEGAEARLEFREGRYKGFTIVQIGFKRSTRRYDCKVILFKHTDIIYSKNKTLLKKRVMEILTSPPIDYLTGRLGI